MRLWQAWRNGDLVIDVAGDRDAPRCAEVMEKYDFADYGDASIVALCERTGLRTVFTLDSDFYAYRLEDGGTLLPTPGSAKGNP